MAACVGALAVREVALCVTGGHFFAVTLYILYVREPEAERARFTPSSPIPVGHSSEATSLNSAKLG
jgi:hypothetical protein